MNRFESNMFIEILISFKVIRFLFGGTWRFYHFGERLPMINMFAVWTRETTFIPDTFKLIDIEKYKSWNERIIELKTYLEN